MRVDRNQLVFLTLQVLEVHLHLLERDVDLVVLELAVDKAVHFVDHRVAVAPGGNVNLPVSGSP